VPAVVVDHKAHASKADFERALLETLRAAGVEWVCLAGFMRLLSGDFLAHYAGRVLNIHPSLLPSFPGLHAQRQALERGVKVAGCTVHFVDAGTDTGPIIAQAAVPVLPGDDEKSLSARILAEEHRLYPLALRLAVTGKVSLEGARTRVEAQATVGELALRSPGAPS
jgi:phosphoribosylglycinamide formyltransferase-1